MNTRPRCVSFQALYTGTRETGNPYQCATQSPGPSTHSQHSPGLEDQISEVPFLPASARKRNVSIAMSNPGVHLVPSLTHAPRHDHGGHVVQLYTDDGFLIDVLSRFIGCCSPTT